MRAALLCLELLVLALGVLLRNAEQRVNSLEKKLLQAEMHRRLSEAAPSRVRSLPPQPEARCGCAAAATRVARGVYPLMREWQCGHQNMEAPRFLTRLRQQDQSPGAMRRVLVDVGLGQDALETLEAVENGFLVLAFEPSAQNIAAIQRRLVTGKRRFNSSVDVVHLTRSANGEWQLPRLQRPPRVCTPSPVKKDVKCRGHAWVVHAALSNITSAGMMLAGAKGSNENMLALDASSNTAERKLRQSTVGAVPVLRLDEALPALLPWVPRVDLLKVDTQGHELFVLSGATKLFEERRIGQVLYEFSPWLMREQGPDAALELLRLLPLYGGLCFDMMGTHHAMPRPSAPLDQFFESLNSGLNGEGSYQMTSRDAVGPWDDILCWLPDNR